MAKAFLALIVWLSLALPVVAAQSQSPSKKAPRPPWSELTPAQKQVLAPLQGEWDALDTTRRKKWIAIANRYPKMKPAAQRRLQKRMTDWVKLTPAERQQAREKYQQMRKLSAARRQQLQEQWQEYQQSLAPPPPPAAPPVEAAPESAATESDTAPAPPRSAAEAALPATQ
jgi:hypothetical protein